eukprot:TRINITY_DN561_c0_g1_i2.p1 TRINITY_DN561_c0_g1~~TRINITY_DN561_c0_g1_i2.p1  ORF type:complete len:242 (-),score=50.60 TRINITY_DN561_c0_g1_i2:173-898(-)
MDLEEWEYLSDDGFLAIRHENGKNNKLTDFDPKPNSPSNLLIQTTDNLGVSNPITEVQKSEKVVQNTGSDHDPLSQVFFKKMKENEFVDMKMDSPKSGNRGIKPQIEVGLIQFGEKEAQQGEDSESKASKIGIEQPIEKNRGNSEMKEKGGLSIWRWRLTGIGALCSIGVATAAVFILIFGARKRQKQLVYQKPQFQIYADDKRIKQVVNHATKLNQAISAVRGVPLVGAHITFGGHYDGL